MRKFHGVHFSINNFFKLHKIIYFSMSVLDSLTSEIFEQLLGQLDYARSVQNCDQNDEATIQEINRLAEELLPREGRELLMLD